MSLELPYSVRVLSTEPLDEKYLNGTIPYTSVAQVNSILVAGVRSIGLTVNIANQEYWYKDNITDGGLILKTPNLANKADLVNGTVPSSQLPSYVDDVLEFANLASLPITGETGKIYVTIDTNKTYRWTGTIYVEISAGVSDHTLLSNIGTNTHAQIDTALNRLANTSGTNTGDQDLSNYALDAEVIHKTGNEIISGVKTIQNNGIIGESLNIKNSDPTNRDNYVLFQNASGTWKLGSEDLIGTTFQLKTENVSAWNVDRITGKMDIGLNNSQPYYTLKVKDNSTGGDTSFLIQAGQTQTSNLITTKYNNNVDAFIVDKDANILYNKNLNKVIVISGDSFSNDVSPFNVDGDFPTYFLYNQKNHDWKHAVTAVAGRTVATMLANYTAEITPYNRNYEHQERMLLLYGGINDIFANRTALAIYNDLKSMWSNAKNHGFTIIAYTICSATSLTSPQEAERVSLNAMILSDRSLYDYVIEASVLFPDPSNTLFFSVDGVHLNTNGAYYLGKLTYDYVFKDYFNVQPTQAVNNGTGKNLVTDSGIKALSFIKNGGTSSQFLKADGSIDSNSYAITNQAYTVATLPTGVLGATAYVTDATAPTYLGTLTGGGIVVCPVFFNGTSWVAH